MDSRLAFLVILACVVGCGNDTELVNLEKVVSNSVPKRYKPLTRDLGTIPMGAGWQGVFVEKYVECRWDQRATLMAQIEQAIEDEVAASNSTIEHRHVLLERNELVALMLFYRNGSHRGVVMAEMTTDGPKEIRAPVRFLLTVSVRGFGG